MKALSKRQHRTIIATLQQLNELAQAAVLPADGFIQHIQSLGERYSHYETLLVQLADCIVEYEAMQKDIRVSVIAPALRQARKQLDKDSTKAIELKQQLISAQGF
ncbi:MULTISPECIES: hypothetical protein [Sphingobacterium]|uniref:hypothetical protein n=1 Tax=Sphingobacterium TaxID=28453 RepID=UPI0021A2709A|nr:MULTISPECIES: hypothetical protein [Sphingobacterium]MCT1525032.1 hypothetical protein [Sphingobacterium hotanense]